MSDSRSSYELFEIELEDSKKQINFKGFMVKRRTGKLLGYVWDENGDPRGEGRRMLYGTEVGTSHPGIVFYLTSGEFSVRNPNGFGYYAEDMEAPGKLKCWTLEEGRMNVFDTPGVIVRGVVLRTKRIEDDGKIVEIFLMEAEKISDDITADMDAAWKMGDYNHIIRE